jgi:hypothetical protein
MKKIAFLLVLVSLFSCKKAAVSLGDFDFRFNNPQPINDSELSRIPIKFQGVFMNLDSTYLNFKENCITQENSYKYRIHKKLKDSLNLEFNFSNGKYISKLNHQVFDSKNIGDSIEMSFKRIDTFFVFSNTQKAKRINGQLVLSMQDSVFWRTKVIELNQNILKIKYISTLEDLKRIDSITKVKSEKIDSTFFLLKPTRSEFNKIIHLKKFGFEEQYKKQKK